MLRPEELLGAPAGAPWVKGWVPPPLPEEGELVGLTGEWWRAPAGCTGGGAWKRLSPN